MNTPPYCFILYFFFKLYCIRLCDESNQPVRRSLYQNAVFVLLSIGLDLAVGRTFLNFYFI